jgi:hypothetical protein
MILLQIIIKVSKQHIQDRREAREILLQDRTILETMLSIASVSSSINGEAVASASSTVSEVTPRMGRRTTQ